MGIAEDKLKQILKDEELLIKNSCPPEGSLFVLIELIRSLDYNMFILSHDVEVKDKKLLEEKYNFGWSLAFCTFYKDFQLTDSVPLFAFDDNDKKWIDNIIQRAGCIGICKQFLDYCKAEVFKLKNERNNFLFYSTQENLGIEYFERLSLVHYHTLIEKILDSKREEILNRLPEMRLKLKSHVEVYHQDFLTYKATPEIDEFYSSLGYLYMMTTQVIDDFDENDCFGGIKYKEYLDCLQQIFKSAIMHRDFCMAIAEKTSHRIYLRNILTHCFLINDYVKIFGKYMEWDENKTKDILSVFTLNKDNIDYHLSSPKVSPPPFIQLGENTRLQSSHGSLNMPIFFLNRELKRKFQKDYFLAVNNREKRFREQLYSLFPDEKIIKIYDCINIKSDHLVTDIDAIMFDNEARTLGLFQLKWQDTFSSSMKERFSRINNLIPKSVEWIDKILNWISTTDQEDLLKTLKINSKWNKVEHIHLFIISKNHVHFSNNNLDERAIWASWYQTIEAVSKVKSFNNSDLIGSFAASLKFFSPEIRKERDSRPSFKNFEIKLSNYKMKFKFNS